MPDRFGKEAEKSKKNAKNASLCCCQPKCRSPKLFVEVWNTNFSHPGKEFFSVAVADFSWEEKKRRNILFFLLWLYRFALLRLRFDIWEFKFVPLHLSTGEGGGTVVAHADEGEGSRECLFGKRLLATIGATIFEFRGRGDKL